MTTEETMNSSDVAAAVAEPEATHTDAAEHAWAGEHTHSAAHAHEHTHTEAAGTTQQQDTEASDVRGELRDMQCEIVISKHVAVSVGAGFIPIPVVDYAAITAVQMRMVYQLCEIFKVPFSKEAARTAIVTLLAGSIPGVQASLFSSSLKMIPGVGTIAGMVLTPTVAGATTYAVGRVFVQHLETGGTLLTFDAAKMRAYFEHALKQAKDKVGKKGMSHS